MNDKKIELSVVIPAYNEETNIAPLYDELKRVMAEIGMEWEAVFVDDGSADGTWKEIGLLKGMFPNIRGMRFSRNFGHQYAVWAGIAAASGSAVISMDADMQHPPQVIERLVEEWKKGFKIVHTIRGDPKKMSVFKKVTAGIFYFLYKYLSGLDTESGMADFRLMDRQVVNEMLKFREQGLFLRGLVQWIGFPDTKIHYRANERLSGKPKYDLKRMIKFTWAGITSFSIVPLRLGILLGMLTSIFAFSEMAYAIYAKYVLKTVQPGWTSAVSVISLLFGIMFILIGLLGEYIGRILIEVQARPRYIVQEEI
jgi:dolichol-phosphate mannosyltransferase